jgi:hypothetical protein
MLFVEWIRPGDGMSLPEFLSVPESHCDSPPSRRPVIQPPRCSRSRVITAGQLSGASQVPAAGSFSLVRRTADIFSFPGRHW